MWACPCRRPPASSSPPLPTLYSLSTVGSNVSATPVSGIFPRKEYKMSSETYRRCLYVRTLTLPYEQAARLEIFTCVLHKKSKSQSKSQHLLVKTYNKRKKLVLTYEKTPNKTYFIKTYVYKVVTSQHPLLLIASKVVKSKPIRIRVTSIHLVHHKCFFLGATGGCGGSYFGLVYKSKPRSALSGLSLIHI